MYALTRQPRGASSQRGAGLIEVMVALLVLGIGMLGILGLQSTAVRYNQQAYLTSQASMLVESIAEKMYANQDAAADYQIGFGSSSPSVSADACVSAGCSPAQIADWDLALWREAIERSLPEGDSEIVSVGGDGEYSITVRFNSERDSEELQSVSMVVQIL